MKLGNGRSRFRAVAQVFLATLVLFPQVVSAKELHSFKASFRPRPLPSGSSFEWLGDAPPLTNALALGCAKIDAGFTSVYSEERARCRRGARLFVARALSRDGRVACSDCHTLHKTDSPEFAPRIVIMGDGLRRPRVRNRELALPRTPALFDIGWKSGRFFWNGRAPSLSSAVYWPLFAHDEMGATRKSLEPFGGADAVAQDLGSFLATLKLGRSPWDDYLEGNKEALREDQQRGAEVFARLGCPGCHAGQELASSGLVGLSYTGLPPDLFRQAEAVYQSDSGLSGPARQTVRLWSVPRGLRNLQLRRGPWGRFGQVDGLMEFVQRHCNQEVEFMGLHRVCHAKPSAAEKIELGNFLLGALRSDDG